MNPSEIRSELRADARRNRESILKAAGQHFTTRGVGASLDEIARDAGVGPGTLYRHFPSREALLAAALSDKQTEVLARAGAARQITDAGAALGAWLRALQDYLRTYDGLASPVLAAIEKQASPLALSCETLIALTGEFLVRAQQDGDARAEITPRALFMSVLGIAWVTNRAELDPTQQDALEAVFRFGYRRKTTGGP